MDQKATEIGKLILKVFLMTEKSTGQFGPDVVQMKEL